MYQKLANSEMVGLTWNDCTDLAWNDPLCSSQMCSLTAKVCKEVDNNKKSRLSFKIIRETHLEMELQNSEAFIYSCL